VHFNSRCVRYFYTTSLSISSFVHVGCAIEGTSLFHDPPVLMARAVLEPGEGRLFLSHEQEVWSFRGGDGTVLAELLVDLGNGIVQDFVLRDSAGVVGDVQGGCSASAAIVPVVASDLRLELSDEGL
jgi:hypothetical protein